MTTQRIRTPKRRKIWAERHTFITLGVGTMTPKTDDLLDPTFTELGAVDLSGLTLMRMFGSFRLVSGTSNPGTAQTDNIRLGVIWLNKQVAVAGDGDAQIPEPLLDGTREGTFVQQWLFAGKEFAVADALAPLGPLELSTVSFDVTQQRKQSTASAKLMLVISGGAAFEANTVQLQIDISCMLALP